jgi:hypothetical protein
VERSKTHKQAFFWMLILAGSLGWLNAQLALALFPHPLLFMPYLAISGWLIGRECAHYVMRRLDQMGEL